MLPAPASAVAAAPSSLTSRPSACSSARIVSATSRSSPVGLRISQSRVKVSWSLSTRRRLMGNRRTLGLRQLRAFRRPLAGLARRGADELAEERLGAIRPRVELGVELGGDEEGVIWQLDHLDQPLVGRGSAADQALVFEPAAQLVVHLVAMAVALVDDGLAEDLARPRAVVQLDRIGAEPHRAQIGRAHV